MSILQTVCKCCGGVCGDGICEGDYRALMCNGVQTVVPIVEIERANSVGPSSSSPGLTPRIVVIEADFEYATPAIVFARNDGLTLPFVADNQPAWSVESPATLTGFRREVTINGETIVFDCIEASGVNATAETNVTTADRASGSGYTPPASFEIVREDVYVSVSQAVTIRADADRAGARNSGVYGHGRDYRTTDGSGVESHYHTGTTLTDDLGSDYSDYDGGAIAFGSAVGGAALCDGEAIVGAEFTKRDFEEVDYPVIGHSGSFSARLDLGSTFDKSTQGARDLPRAIDVAGVAWIECNPITGAPGYDPSEAYVDDEEEPRPAIWRGCDFSGRLVLASAGVRSGGPYDICHPYWCMYHAQALTDFVVYNNDGWFHPTLSGSPTTPNSVVLYRVGQKLWKFEFNAIGDSDGSIVRRGFLVKTESKDPTTATEVEQTDLPHYWRPHRADGSQATFADPSPPNTKVSYVRDEAGQPSFTSNSITIVDSGCQQGDPMQPCDGDAACTKCEKCGDAPSTVEVASNEASGRYAGSWLATKVSSNPCRYEWNVPGQHYGVIDFYLDSGRHMMMKIWNASTGGLERAFMKPCERIRGLSGVPQWDIGEAANQIEGDFNIGLFGGSSVFTVNAA